MHSLALPASALRYRSTCSWLSLHCILYNFYGEGGVIEVEDFLGDGLVVEDYRILVCLHDWIRFWVCYAIFEMDINVKLQVGDKLLKVDISAQNIEGKVNGEVVDKIYILFHQL